MTGCNARSVSRPIGDYTPTSSLAGLDRDFSKTPERVYKLPGAKDFDAYDNFIVGPILIDYRDSDMEDLSQETIAKIESTIVDKISTQLRDGGYSVGTRSSEGTMRMSFVISGFSAPAEGGAINAASMAAGAVVGVPMLVTISTGEVTVEGRFTDAYTKEVQAVVIDRSAGARIFNGNPLSTWEDVESAFATWAKGIRESVDEAHGK